jgi:hypothetical protein
VVLTKVSIAVVPDPLPAVLPMPGTAALVQEKLVLGVPLVAVYDADISVHRIAVAGLVNVGVGFTVTVTFWELLHPFADKV